MLGIPIHSLAKHPARLARRGIEPGAPRMLSELVTAKPCGSFLPPTIISFVKDFLLQLLPTIEITAV